MNDKDLLEWVKQRLKEYNIENESIAIKIASIADEYNLDSHATSDIIYLVADVFRIYEDIPILPGIYKSDIEKLQGGCQMNKEKVDNGLTNELVPKRNQFKIPVEVYSRVVGYFRPTRNWNKGKKSEFKDRKTFKVQ